MASQKEASIFAVVSAGPQAAQAAYAERDGNARPARFVQLADDFRVLELIQFDADAAGAARPLMVRFAADQLREALAHVVRGHQQGAVILDRDRPGKLVEHRGHARGQGRIATGIPRSSYRRAVTL